MLVAALGAVAGSVFVPVQRPAVLRAGPTAQVIAPQRQVFDDARIVAFEPVRRPTTEVVAPRDGVVTSATCKPGARLSSGDVPATIDGAPVVAFWTSYPLYRDIANGDRGEDVDAVQQELTRLGYRPGTGAWGPAAMAAWRAFLKDRGVAKPEGEPVRAQLAALPAKRAQILACPAKAGAPIAAGGSLVTLGGQLTRLKLAAELTGAAPGERVARYGKRSALVAADGKVSDARFLADVAAGPEYAAWSESKGESPLTLSYALAKPADALVVPSAALYGVNGERACLLADGKPVSVTILTSRLGSTYVSAGVKPSRVTIPATQDRAGSGTCT